MQMDATFQPDLGRAFVIIGGGPAGLTAGYELVQRGFRPLIVEKLDKVGGIARTENYRGYSFDMGGHRFYTKSSEVMAMWQRVLGDEFLLRPRLSRIYYDRKFFNYPLKPFNALRGIGLWKGVQVGLSYLRWQIFPYRQENTFEEWVTNRFGKRLFEIFFKSYTEKVWGISTSELSAEWAAQRIKDLDLKAAILSMFVKPKETITTLIEEFHYPRRGPGMLWNQVKEDIEASGGEVHLNSGVCRVLRDGSRITGVVVSRPEGEQVIPGTDFISSMPITDFICKLEPPPPPAVLEAAGHLKYRDFLTVCLLVRGENLFADNWIYIHDPAVQVGRIQNFKNWSPSMVPEAGMSSLGLEYFCNQGDELWSMDDQDLVALGRREIEAIGLARAADVTDGCVFRVENAYPVYDSTYTQHLAVLRKYVEGFENFQTIGRNGLHRYNNQDHAMLTGMLAVRNLVCSEKNDLWSVNGEQEYQEEIRQPEIEKAVKTAFQKAFLKMDPRALGMAVGAVSGLLLFALTLWVMWFGLEDVAIQLYNLNQYIPFYSVSYMGSLVGLVGGLVAGFIPGWLFAVLRNMVVLLSLAVMNRKMEMEIFRKMLDF